MKWFKRRRARKSIDAVAEIEQAQAEQIALGVNRPDVTGAQRPLAPGAKAFILLLLLVVMTFLAVLTWRSWQSSETRERERGQAGPVTAIRNVLPALDLQQPAPPAPEPEPEPPGDLAPKDLNQDLFARPPGRDVRDAVAEKVDPVIQRRLSSGLKGPEPQSRSSTDTRGDGIASAQEPDSGPLADSLRPLRLSSARAGTIGDRDLLLTQGAMIDCVMQTRLVSAQAGMITCHATREVRSASGRVVLIDPGTLFVGYQRGVLAQGQPRIGVVWSRLETPQGVVVNLDSPGTGPLGEAGLDGHIDTHFAERFGGAIMISLIDDLGSWASSRHRGGDGIRFDGTSDAAQDAVATVLDNTINIPPTLYRNQGGRVGIYVARDLDFSGVYELRAR